jgi:hypothetical protein
MFTSHPKLFNLGTSDQEDCVPNLRLVTRTPSVILLCPVLVFCVF